MKKLLLLFSLILLVSISCKDEDSNKPSGIYLEKAPIEFRTKMDFTSTDRVTITYIDGISKEFSYSVGEKVMTLTPIKSATYPAKNLFYHYTDPTIFELENIYDPMDEMMIFEIPKPKK